MDLERSRSNISKETREEDPRDSVSLFSDIHRMPIKQFKSSMDLSLRAERYLPEKTKAIPLSRLTRRIQKKMLVRQEAKVLQLEELRNQSELMTSP